MGPRDHEELDPDRRPQRPHPRRLAFALAMSVAACGDSSVGGDGSSASASATEGDSETSTEGTATTTDAGTTHASADATSGASTDATSTSDASASVTTSASTSASTTDPTASSGPDTDGCVDEVPPEPPHVAHPPGEYTGVEYDFGGATTPISGQVPVVDAIAESIAAEAAAVAQEIADRRAQLAHGRVDPDTCEPDQLVVYPGPPGIPASDQYAVTVVQSGVEVPSFVYKIDARKPDTNRELDTSWTTFSFKGPIEVRVQKLGGGATGCVVRPFQRGITTSFAADTCTFTISEAGPLSVEFEPNIHNPILHPMLVFADPTEVAVPPADGPGVRFYGPGVHQLGAGQPIHSGDTIYLAGGAWVEGAFVADGPVNDVVIRGRGVLSGLFLDKHDQDLNKDQPGMIDVPYQASDNLVIEGVTLVDGPRFNIRALAQHTTIAGVKVMSWWFSTDGVVGGHKSVIQDSFIKVNDDSIKLHWGDTIARRNVLWQLENGGTFNLSWNIHDDVATFHVHDNDVIHAEHYLFEAEAVFRSRHAGSGTLSRYLFEDIRVENANWRLFYLVLEENKWYDPNLGFGEIEQVIFRDIHAYSESHQRPNVVLGIDGTHKVRNVSFQNVFTDGVCISNAQNGDFQIDPKTTHAVRIMKSSDGTCQTP